MSERFVISDTHFHHHGILRFCDNSGKPIRNFINVDEMDDVLIENWNKKIGKKDTVWHLGDVAFGYPEQTAKTMRRLNGNKKLILGNHDDLTPEFINCFSEIMLWKKLKSENMIFSHMPLDDSVISECSPTAINVHGHIHKNPAPTNRHVNICVEWTNYSPLSFDEIPRKRKVD